MRMVHAFSVVLITWISATWLSTAVPAPRVGLTCQRGLENLNFFKKLCTCSPCHACGWNGSECSLNVTSLDDGSSIPIKQPILHSQKWFLTFNELTKARNGIPRTQMSEYTTNNTVTVFAATNEYFLSLYHEVEATGKDDLMYMTGWSVADIPFDPQHNLVGSDFKSMLTRAVDRGMDYRGIIWANGIDLKQVVKFHHFANRVLPPPAKYGPGRLLFDDRLKSAMSTHHQKTVVMRRQDQLIAFVGGVDLTVDRWDTIRHDQKKLRHRANISMIYNGWLDAELRINGPAALDVGHNFVQRWNSKTHPIQNFRQEFLGKNPNYKDLPPMEIPPNVPRETNGTHDVQIAFTYTCEYKKYEYAPRGEHSILDARIKAIQHAQNFILIEDQYFILVPELLQALLKVLPRLQRVIIVVQRILDTNERKVGYLKYMYEMVAPLQAQFPNKIQFYTTKKELNLYIHSKMVLIDDVYLSIGSANWNRRSMTSDSEIGANVVDRDHVITPDGIQVGKLPYDYRLRKFAEYTGKTYEELRTMTFIEAANALDEAAESPYTILAPYEVHERAKFPLYISEIREFFDPQDVCEYDDSSETDDSSEREVSH